MSVIDKSCCALLVFLSLCPESGTAAPINILHTFTSGATDGRSPTGLLLEGSVLYGTTNIGGLNNAGTVYRLNTDGSGFNLLHTFTGLSGNGQNPRGNLAIDGSTLYGTTASFGGSVYKIETDGTGFANLHRFNYPAARTDPESPVTGVTLVGSTIYGTTVDGGSNADPVIVPNQAGNGGTVFSLATNGTSFTELHGFDPSTIDGWAPRTALTSSGQVLYGMTRGANPISPNAGTIFKINADGTGFSTLHQFSNSSTIRPDGAFPTENGLVLVGNRLYGVTSSGGFIPGVALNRGIIFGIDTDGSNFDVLHTFGAGSDGAQPMGSLALDGNTIYGVTQAGGVHDKGTIYQINLDGTGYNKIHDFAGGSLDGSSPFEGGLIVDGNQLYGTTTRGGQFDIGVVYSLTLIPEPTTFSLAIAAVCYANGRRR